MLSFRCTGQLIRQACSDLFIIIPIGKGKIVKNENKLLYAQLMARMLFDQADWMPYYNRILQARRKRFLHGLSRDRPPALTRRAAPTVT